jgi:hypothetical protein
MIANKRIHIRKDCLCPSATPTRGSTDVLRPHGQLRRRRALPKTRTPIEPGASLNSPWRVTAPRNPPSANSTAIPWPSAGPSRFPSRGLPVLRDRTQVQR